MWRVDHVRTGRTVAEPPQWFASEAEAVAEETRLHLVGVTRAVAWFCGGAS